MTAARRRLQSPTGTLVWLCVSQSGHRTIHATEQAAKNRAAVTEKSTIFPLVVELDETEEKSA